MAVTLRRVDKLHREPRAKGAADLKGYTAAYTAALERALHEALLALAALNQQKQELSRRLKDVRQLALQPQAAPDAVQQIRRVLYEMPFDAEEAPTAGGIM